MAPDATEAPTVPPESSPARQLHAHPTPRDGIRWAEVRSTDGDTGWFRQQDGTLAPADGLERWMGSIAQDRDGNIALGYSVNWPALRSR